MSRLDEIAGRVRRLSAELKVAVRDAAESGSDHDSARVVVTGAQLDGAMREHFETSTVALAEAEARVAKLERELGDANKRAFELERRLRAAEVAA